MTSPYINIYQGAYGKTLLIRLYSEESLQRLLAIFIPLAGGFARAANCDLLSLWGTVSVVNRPPRLKLSLVDKVTSRVICEGEPDEVMNWSNTLDGWLDVVEMLNALLEAGSGHQYLTDEELDDVLVKVSLNE